MSKLLIAGKQYDLGTIEGVNDVANLIEKAQINESRQIALSIMTLTVSLISENEDLENQLIDANEASEFD